MDNREKRSSAKISLWGKINNAIFSRKRNQGFALLYVIGALLLTTFIGAALVKLSHHDVMSATDYSAMATAAITARSGMQAAVAKFEQQSQVTVDSLNNYLADPDNRNWFVASENDPIVLNSQQKYNVKILGFDKINYTVQIEGTGWGKGGSMKKVVGIYKLEGIEFPTSWDFTKEHALYMGDITGSISIYSPLTIEGAAYFSSKIDFDSDASGSVFKGNFRIGLQVGGDPYQRFQGTYTFQKVAYFGHKVYMDGSGNFICQDKSGFENGAQMTGSNNFNFQKDSYFNANIINNTVTVAVTSPYKLHHNGTYSYPTPAASFLEDEGSDIDILFELGLESDKSPVSVDIDVIYNDAYIYSWNDLKDGGETGYTPGSNGVDGEMLNLIHTYADGEGNLWNGFAVMEVDAQMLTVLGSNQDFTEKIILIVKSPNTLQPNAAGKCYNSSTEAITMIYIESGGSVQNFGGWSQRFRGFIHCAAGGTLVMGGSSNNVGNIEGAVHWSEGSNLAAWYPDPSQTTIQYDPEVFNALAFDSFITIPGQTEIPENTLVLTSPNITTTLLGMYF